MANVRVYTAPTDDMLMSRSRTFVSINDSATCAQNFQIKHTGLGYVYSFFSKFACGCKNCTSSTPTTPGPFACERKGCSNTHGNWNVEAQRREWPEEYQAGRNDGQLDGNDGMPGMGWSGFCCYSCAVQTYYEIKYDLCCLSAGNPVDITEISEDLPCKCCFTLCCARQMYDPADERLLKAGRTVEVGGAHCCCYTAFPNWKQNTESLEMAGVGKLVEGMAKRDLTNQQIADGHEIDFENAELEDLKKVISRKVLASETLYDQAYTDRVKEMAAKFRTMEAGQSIKPLQDCSTIFQLYEQARELEITLKEFLNTAGIDPKKMNGVHSSTSIKGIRRAMTKINMSYGLNILKLTDVCRGSLMFDDIATMGNALGWMLDHPEEIEVLRIKNRFLAGRAAPGGYRDVLVNCRFPNDLHQHVVEVQLHLKAYHDLKKGGGGHKVYKIARFVDAMGPTSTYSLQKRLEEEMWDEATGNMYQRLVQCATGKDMHCVFQQLESKEHLGSIRGELSIENAMMCIMMLLGNGIALEMEAGTITKREIVSSACPPEPIDATIDVKNLEPVVQNRFKLVNNSMLAIVVEIGKVLSPVILSADTTNVDASTSLDCESLVRKIALETDWMNQNMITSLMDKEFAEMLDSNCSGSASLGELENGIKFVCHALVRAEKQVVASKAFSEQEEQKKKEGEQGEEANEAKEAKEGKEAKEAKE